MISEEERALLKQQTWETASQQNKVAKIAGRAREEEEQQQEYKEILQKLQEPDLVYKEITQQFHANQKVNINKTNTYIYKGKALEAFGATT